MTEDNRNLDTSHVRQAASDRGPGEPGLLPASKLVYLARRNPDFTYEQFIRRWRQHGGLAMGLERWAAIWRYVQCDIKPAPEELPVTPGYDGIGIVWYRGLGRSSSGDRETLREDERKVFSDYVDKAQLYLAEDVRKPGAGLIKANFFITRNAASKPRVWRDSPLVRGYVHNDTVPATPRTSDLPFGSLEEYWFDSIETLGEYFLAGESPWHDPSVDHANSLFLVTNELVLYDFPVVSATVSVG